jgi:hypothetical protein
MLLTGVALRAVAQDLGKVYWETNGVPISVAPGLQGIPHVTTDGNHGMILAWADCRPSATGCDIYAQRIDAEGHIQWQTDGIPVNTEPDDQLGPRIVSDEAGGALVVWSDFRNHTDYSVYAQRLDSAGNRLWASDGITIAAGMGHQVAWGLVPDTSGGAFVIWEDQPDLSSDDVNLFAQHLSRQGDLLWPTPVTVIAAPGGQYYSDSAPDGAGGFLVLWNMSAQRISAEGRALWASEGVRISSASAYQVPGYILSDGNCGAYVTWYDFRSNVHLADVYMQRITAAGALAWESDLPVVANFDDAEGPNDLITDGSGGAILVASRYIDGGAVEVDVLAQHVGRNGELLWGAEPVNVTPWEKQQDFAVALPDGAGGAYVAWIDKYSDPPAYDIWAQHLGSDGARLWPDHGTLVVAAPGLQDWPMLISDGANGFIVAWQDFRDDPDIPDESDIYAQRVGNLELQPRSYLPLIQK